MRIDLALAHGWPGAQWSLDGEEYEGLTWLDASPKPTLVHIEAAWASRNLAARSATARKAELAAIRYAKETGGIVVGGAAIATDRDTQAKLIAVRIKAKEDSGYTVNWKTLAGFVSLNAATIIAIADAVSAHIQACFDREAVLTAAIDGAANQAALDALDLNSGWP